MKRAWLQPFTWAVIVETNRQLCQPKGALHKATSDGYERTRQLSESLRQTEMTLGDATDLCPPEQAVIMRSLAGHIVAGTATLEEERTFGELLNRLATPESPTP